MAVLEHQLDVAFYNLVHQLVGAEQQDQTAERRRSRRQPFSSMQRIAPRRHPGIPDESEFFDIPCHDLSATGFSFLLPDKPGCDSLVAAFGSPPDTIYMGARISHYLDVVVDSSGRVRSLESPMPEMRCRGATDDTAKRMVLVGCEFTSRLRG